MGIALPSPSTDLPSPSLASPRLPSPSLAFRQMRKEVGIELFAKHAAPFFEWLAADDDDDDDEAAAKPPKAKAEDPVEVS